MQKYRKYREKIIVQVIAVLMAILLVGCSSKNTTDSEKQLIQISKELIEEKYNLSIEEGEYLYSVGKQINENEFVDLESDIKPEKGYENIVSVSATISSAPKDNQIIGYSVIFNLSTKKVYKIEIEK